MLRSPFVSRNSFGWRCGGWSGVRRPCTSGRSRFGARDWTGDKDLEGGYGWYVRVVCDGFGGRVGFRDEDSGQRMSGERRVPEGGQVLGYEL